MLELFPFYLVLIFLIMLLVMIGNAIKVAYPVLLVVAGLLLSFIPGVPSISIEPELIFVIFLPPLLYEAAWAISWKELWHWRRIIGSFAFVVVFLSASTVALVANYMIPGFSLALGFLLGGIVSPPDAVSASAILKFVKVPRRLATILEGESLLNDASSLIIFRFALIAVATGQFVWQEAALSFGWMIAGGLGIGLLVGFVFKKVQTWLPTDVNMDIIFTLIAPYTMYILAEEVHSSGVLSVVSGGLFLSYHRHRFLPASSRLRAEHVWQSLVFLLNGLVFLLIGLDLPEITSGLRAEGISFSEATWYGVLVTLVLIFGRILAAYGAVLVTMVVGRFATVADRRNPGPVTPLILGWTGMRGVVSLAAALSIPLTLADGSLFPHRNLILFITFVVILLTLIVQGLTLPILIQKVKLPDFGDHLPQEETEDLIRKNLVRESRTFLAESHVSNWRENPVIQNFLSLWSGESDTGESLKITREDKELILALLERLRQSLLEMNKSKPEIDEETIREFLLYIDLEEEKIKMA